MGQKITENTIAKKIKNKRTKKRMLAADRKWRAKTQINLEHGIRYRRVAALQQYRTNKYVYTVFLKEL